MSTRYEALKRTTFRQRVEFLLGDSLVFGGANAANKLLALFTVPVLTRYFSTAAYGSIDAISALVALAAAFTVFGQDSAAARYYYDTEDEGRRKQVITQALVTAIVISGVSASLLLAGSGLLARRALGNAELAPALRVMIAALPALVLDAFFRNILKWTFSRNAFVVLSLGSSALVVALTLLLAVKFRLGVMGVFWAQFAGMSVSAAAGFLACRKYLAWPENLGMGAEMARFGWPFAVTALARAGMPALDRLFIVNFLGLAVMGWYAVGNRLAGLMAMPVMAFQMAWGPFSFALHKEPDAAATYNRIFLYFSIAFSLMAFALAMVAEPAVVLLASGDYVNGKDAVLPLAFTAVVEAASWITGMGIGLSKRTRYYMYGYLLGLAGTALCVYLLIPFGLPGVAYGVLGGRLIQTFACTYFASRAYPLRFAWRAPLAVTASAFALAVLLQASDLPPSREIAARAAAFVTLAGGIWIWAVPAGDKRAVLRRKNLDILES